jgi:hypothetical protein
MTRQDVANAGRKWKALNPDPRFKNGRAPWEEQVKEAEQWLKLSAEGSRVSVLSAVVQRDGSASECLLWAHPERIELLCWRGHLALMDATHGTNKLGWYLYTVMVRDENGTHRPVAHFLTRRQDGDIVAAALKELRGWTGGPEGWQCRWFLTDDSAAEQKAVREAFPSTPGGGEETGHLLCRFHMGQQLTRRFRKSHPALAHLLAILRYRRTRAGAEASMAAALDAIECLGHPSKKEEDLRYLQNFLIPTMDQWGHYVRTESALLLQATTTNPIESWHAVLKHKQINKTTVKQFSLKGIIRHVEVYAKEYDTRAETRRHQFWTRHNPLWKDFEALKEFPYPVQNLLAKEIRLAKDLCVENDEQLLVSSAPEADSQGNAKPPICGKPC